jgi:formylglycine-generating enzyme required for sulfatase activity
MSRFFISHRHDDSADASVRLYERLASLGFAARKVGDTEFIVPPVVPVQAGEFLMGSDPRQDASASDSEQPRHRVALPAYQIGRFPVTVAEYACFARAGRESPKNWQSQLGKLDHPVVYVSWHDAVAYAAWLAERTGQPL